MAPMQTECSATLFEFEAVERRAVMAGFDGGDITSNAGALLLGQVDRGLGLIRRFGECFTDRRDPGYVEHRIETLVGQRIFGLVLGYEDLNDHDELRKDPTLGVLTGKLHPVLRSDCEALAGKSTLKWPIFRLVWRRAGWRCIRPKPRSSTARTATGEAIIRTSVLTSSDTAFGPVGQKTRGPVKCSATFSRRSASRHWRPCGRRSGTWTFDDKPKCQWPI